MQCPSHPRHDAVYTASHTFWSSGASTTLAGKKRKVEYELDAHKRVLASNVASLETAKAILDLQGDGLASRVPAPKTLEEARKQLTEGNLFEFFSRACTYCLCFAERAVVDVETTPQGRSESIGSNLMEQGLSATLTPDDVPGAFTMMLQQSDLQI